MKGDRAMVETLLAWRAAGHQVTLLTVAATCGAPAPPEGSLMAVRDDGATFGALTGGPVERDLVARLRAGEIAAEKPMRIACGATPDEAARLSCGGRLEIIAERLRDPHGLEAVHAALVDRRSRVRRVQLASGAVEITDAGRDFHCDERLLERRYAPAWRLLLIGATDLARHLLHGAAHLDYEIIVCDPREEIRTAWNLCDAAHQVVVDPRLPGEAAAVYGDDERTAVITLTRDPRLDDPALLRALAGRAFYVGALGPPPEIARRRARIGPHLPPRALARLHAPVGLPIGSRTPAEIALSILAHVTAVQRGLECGARTPAEHVS